MTEEEMASLCDVYQTLDPERKTIKTQSILQTVWQDLSWCARSLLHISDRIQHMLVIIQDSMLKWHWFGFHTVAVIDGTSPNLTMIKLWTEGKKGAYGGVDDPTVTDKHVVKPWFIDPFNGQNVYFIIICPSLQVRCLCYSECMVYTH